MKTFAERKLSQCSLLTSSNNQFGRVNDVTGVLVVLDARPDGIIYRDLVPEYVKFVRTIYEGWFFITIPALFLSQSLKMQLFLKFGMSLWDALITRTCCSWSDEFGDIVADVNYLNVGKPVPDYQIFICWHSSCDELNLTKLHICCESYHHMCSCLVSINAVAFFPR